jgi:DNA-directed RNA polymerase specialized sigma24 family protein
MKSKIRELKDPYRKVIEMRELQKMSYKDISKNLNKNLSTIKSQIRNGRILLKKQTENDFKKIEEMY